MRDLGAVLDHEEALPHPAGNRAQQTRNLGASRRLRSPAIPPGVSNLQGGNVWPKSLFSWHCLLISSMAALLLVSPLTARALPPRYSARKGFGRYLAMLGLWRSAALPISRSANSTTSICFADLGK